MTPQSITSLKELTTLHNAYHKFGLEILAFPCDQFGSQANGGVGRKSRDKDDLREKLGINYTMMEKVDVNGAEAHPVFRLLKQQGPDIRGNFQTSFLVVCGGDRCTVHRFDGLQPRALGSRIQQLLTASESDEDVLISGTMAA